MVLQTKVKIEFHIPLNQLPEIQQDLIWIATQAPTCSRTTNLEITATLSPWQNGCSIFPKVNKEYEVSEYIGHRWSASRKYELRDDALQLVKENFRYSCGDYE
ncbi:hypothetical protein HYV86_00845 [Candidatus Woesearchaeota archaeon]|nr:hypothetical protein [Candidatus Woesearchaeota archaeon]